MFADLPIDIARAPANLGDFSIAHLGPGAPFHVDRSCRGGGGAEIVVCGRRGDSPYRLQPLPPSGIAPPDAGLPVGIDLAPNLRAGADITQHVRPDGFVAQEIWLRFRLRF